MTYQELKNYTFAKGKITSGYGISPKVEVSFALNPHNEKLCLIAESGYCTYNQTYDDTFPTIAEAYAALEKVNPKYLTELEKI